MKKLAFDYLDVAYPNLYLRVTVFGNLMEGYDDSRRMWPLIQEEMTLTIAKLFNIEFSTSVDIVKEWCASRPKFQSIRISTNEVVLVPTDSSTYSTVLLGS